MNRIVMLVVAMVLVSASAIAQNYTVVDLSQNFATPYHFDRATAINIRGTIVASGYENGGYVTKIVTPNAYLIASPYGKGDYVRAINESGAMVGVSSDNQGWSLATVWNVDGSLALVGPRSSQACGINEFGTIVGSEQGLYAFMIKNGSKHYLTVPGYPFAGANAINNRRVVVGAARSGDYGYYSNPCRWDAAGNAQVLPNLGNGQQIGWFTSVNNYAYAVGTSLNNDGSMRAVVASPTTTLLRDLGTLGGYASSANRINNSRVIVGWSYDAQNRKVPFAWYADRMHALPLLPGTVEGEALDINGADTIVGYCTDNLGHNFACLWLP